MRRTNNNSHRGNMSEKQKTRQPTRGGGFLTPTRTNKAKTKQKAMKHFVQGQE